MRLLIGPPGSGKTAAILGELRAALRNGEARSVRLLAPTATLAQHMRNELAREGFIFPHSTVQTLNEFIAPWTSGLREVSDALFYWIVEDAARRVHPPEFAGVLEYRGFSASLARVIEEFSAAGCDSARLASRLPDAALAAPFLAVYREVDRELERRGLALRARRLSRAAERIAAEGTGLGTVWIDGFHALPEPDLSVIAALARKARVTIALSDFAAPETRRRLEELGFLAERLTGRREPAAMAIFKAAGIEREAEEIARRILEQSAGRLSGERLSTEHRPFREIGVIVRAADVYAPVLRSTFARFGIPARFYFDSPLEEHAAVRFLSGAVDALLSNWDHAATLAALRLAPRFTDSNTMDRFDFSVREQIPNHGLESLRELAGTDEALGRVIASLAALDEWRGLTLTPGEWILRFETLRSLFRPTRPSAGADRNLALLYRGQAAALDAFEQAVAEAAEAFAPKASLALADFWRAAQSAIRLTPLRVRDGRRNAVHILSAYEARQWTLPSVFVCGLTERQFPQFHRQDPFFPEFARLNLNEAGIRIRTAAAFEKEERALFDAAITRGSSLVTLSYPEYDARGERNLPSIFLERVRAPEEEARAVRPRPKVHWRLPERAPIAAPSLRDYLRQRTEHLSPSALESYLQCAFQHFGGRLLRLKPAPKRPEQRLNENYLLQGEIVHDVLHAAYTQPERVAEVFEEKFEAVRLEHRIPNSYHTERLRNAMREDLLAFIADDEWPRALFETRAEEKFDFPLDTALAIRGRIDRIDTAAGGNSYVIDYKYSAAQRTKAKLKDENLLQAPLYYLAAREAFHVEPDGVFYIGLKKGVAYVGWSHSGFLGSEPIPADWIERARARTLEAAAEIRNGRIEVRPANADNCLYCDCRDICRVVPNAPAIREAAASESA
jgi:ATP-dependent helicase/DNAse subunit B